MNSEVLVTTGGFQGHTEVAHLGKNERNRGQKNLSSFVNYYFPDYKRDLIILF